MAVAEGAHPFQILRLDTGRTSPKKALRSDVEAGGEELRTTDYFDFFNHDTTRAQQMRRVESVSEHAPTPPITIPNGHGADDKLSAEHGDLASDPQQSQQSSLDGFLQNRRTSITFDPTLRLDSGERQHMERPLQKPAKPRARGRSLLQAMADDKERQQRAHSESGRNHYDPVTGEPCHHDGRKERDGPHVGELRHPLLPATVDELARESQTDLPASMTSEATLSPPMEEVRTPSDNKPDYLLSPLTAFPLFHPHSYDEKSSYRRYAERSQTAAADFFTRAGSLRKSPLASANRQAARRSTSSSNKSPKSAASSFLASFSGGRRSRNGNGGDAFDTRPVSPDAEGQTVGDDYVLGKQIGFGGFSTIKEAFHMSSSGSPRKLAVKVVRRNIDGKSELENEQAQAEFDHEVELWRFLKHPRILPLEAVYKTEDATFCFIPLNVGGTLFDLVRANRSGVPSSLAKRYSYQLATAIRYLHEDARVAHRDVKLENCLLDTSVDPANVRLCDFGMAEWITNDNTSSFDGPPSPITHFADRPPQRNMGPSDTSTSAFAGGSLEYAAPEIVKIAGSTPPEQQQKAERGLVSPASDIWALGVCIYTLIVGSRPFQDSFQPRVVMAILAADWDQQRLREKGGEDALELVRGCLEMDVRARWEIEDVLMCAWLREEVEQDEEQDAGCGGDWGL
jgi:serine/threonine protein kinase